MSTERELERADGDRRLFEIAGVGTLRFEGLMSRRAAATAGGLGEDANAAAGAAASTAATG